MAQRTMLALLGKLRQPFPPILECSSNFRTLSTASSQLQAVRELREKSGAPISEVKEALDLANYNSEEAFQTLRKRGLAAATKKASRYAAEGLIGLAVNRDGGVLVEVNSETDFVARNDQFKNVVSLATQAALRIASGSQAGPASKDLNIAELESQVIESGESLSAVLQEVASSVRENLRIRRASRISAEGGVLAGYLHISPSPGLGRIGSLVAIEASSGPIPEDKRPSVEDIGSKLAMHVVAARPRFLDQASVPASTLEAEKEILRAQAAKTGKPANIVEKMVLGRMNKFYEETCLLEQAFIMDDSTNVREVLKRVSKDIGIDLRLTNYERLQCGEGLEEQHQRKDFATEVKDTIEKAVQA